MIIVTSVLMFLEEKKRTNSVTVMGGWQGALWGLTPSASSACPQVERLIESLARERSHCKHEDKLFSEHLLCTCHFTYRILQVSEAVQVDNKHLDFGGWQSWGQIHICHSLQRPVTFLNI